MKSYLMASVLVLAAALVRETCSVLTAEYLEVKLPSPNYCQAASYDGQDQIYLFGGCHTQDQEILSYSLASETISVVGALPGPAFGGSVERDVFGNIYYFGGGIRGNQVYKFDPITNTTTVVGRLPYDTYGSSSLTYNNRVYILGGHKLEGKVLEFNLETLTSSVVAHLPSTYLLGTIDRVGNKGYGAPGGFRYFAALELDLDSLQIAEVGEADFLGVIDNPTSVTDGTFTYVIGGYTNLNGRRGDLIQFNTKTLENKFLPVDNLLRGKGDLYTTSPASVFVPSRNRIYCFGGQSFNDTSTTYDDIFYMDLTGLE